MKLNEKDRMHELFSGMQDEPLPLNFKEKVMSVIRREALRREKRNKQLEVFGYVTGTVAMTAVCIFILHYMGISFELPEFNRQSSMLSIFTGTSALFLLIIDSIIRRQIEKKHK
jgi:hypothetical protein